MFYNDIYKIHEVYDEIMTTVRAYLKNYSPHSLYHFQRADKTNDTMKRQLQTALVLLLIVTIAAAETLHVGNFSNGELSAWQEKQFNRQTHYTLQQDDERIVLTAISSNAASGLFKNISVDLNKTPILHWSWKINNTLTSKNEREKSGDDFSARVYIVFSDGPFFWQTKTLSYVWANQSPVGAHWPNPYTDSAHMFAIQSGGQHIKQWRYESRNVKHDIQTVFGKNIAHIEAIAIMTDTDQTGAATQAWYGDMWFSDQ